MQSHHHLPKVANTVHNQGHKAGMFPLGQSLDLDTVTVTDSIVATVQRDVTHKFSVALLLQIETLDLHMVARVDNNNGLTQK